MVTASHNPKQDNGYKVYWNNGSQIVPPHDTGIAAAIHDNLAPWQVYDTSVAGIENNPLCEMSTARVADAYYASIVQLGDHRVDNATNPVKAVYTGEQRRHMSSTLDCSSLNFCSISNQ